MTLRFALLCPVGLGIPCQITVPLENEREEREMITDHPN